MKLGLDGKAAIVTGGSGGIGSAIIAALAHAGCAVASVHRGEVDVPGAALSLDRDVADFDSAQDTVAHVTETLGGLDMLVCSAGITADRVSWKMSENEWDRVLDVNLKGTFNYCRAAAPALKESGGRIVNIASINGLRGKFGQANYAASKGGLIAMTKTLARELGRYGVTVNAVAPGLVETPMAAAIPEEFIEAAKTESVLGRVAEPADVADLVLFLCSERARHITGECIRVDGGQYI
ncbi:MAG: SDR family oxidoreductase [Planctomycetota bacterium]|jgi:NAD(P)-dependent dehydrogenase (short-subunit alcohol dehydrogenase family)